MFYLIWYAQDIKKICSYASVYYGNYFGILFNATLVFSNKLINNNFEWSVAFYFIFAKWKEEKNVRLFKINLTFYEVVSNSSHSTILLFKYTFINFYLHICIFECNFASYHCDHNFSPNRDKAEYDWFISSFCDSAPFYNTGF